jgi:hypothetical protein
MKKSCSIYGPDLSEHEAEGARIAKQGMKCMEGDGGKGSAPMPPESDTSKSELEKFKPSNP